jgi:hypothetical protein
VQGNTDGGHTLTYWVGKVADITVGSGVATGAQLYFLKKQCPIDNLPCRLLPGD